MPNGKVWDEEPEEESAEENADAPAVNVLEGGNGLWSPVGPFLEALFGRAQNATGRVTERTSLPCSGGFACFLLATASVFGELLEG